MDKSNDSSFDALRQQFNYLRILDFRGFSYSIFEEIRTRFSRFGLQVDPLKQGLVELGVVVAGPGKERLVKIAWRSGDAKDAGDLHAHELQRGQFVDGRERKRRRGLLEQVVAALQRAAAGARAGERCGLGGARRYRLVAAALVQVVADFGRYAAQRGDDGHGVGAGGIDCDVARVVRGGRVAGRGLAARILGRPIRNAKGRDRRLLVALPAFALAQHQVDVGRAGVGVIHAGQPRGKGLGVDAIGHVPDLLGPVPLGAQGLGLVFVRKGNIELGAHGGSFVRLAVHVLQGYPSGGRAVRRTSALNVREVAERFGKGAPSSKWASKWSAFGQLSGKLAESLTDLHLDVDE